MNTMCVPGFTTSHFVVLYRTEHVHCISCLVVRSTDEIINLVKRGIDIDDPIVALCEKMFGFGYF